MAASSTSSTAAAPRGRKSPESFESLRKRNAAAEILQSYEQLSWHAFQRCETISQTRQHFQCIVAGFSSDDETDRVFWKEDRTPRPTKEAHQPNRKGKERVSVGGASERREMVEGAGAGGESPRARGTGGGSSTAEKERSTPRKKKVGGGDDDDMYM